MMHKVIMPDLGQTVAEGRIVRWLRKPGDRIQKGEPLLEVETDKVTMEVEAFKDGFLREFFAHEGQWVSAMTPIAVLTDDPAELYERPGPVGSGSSPRAAHTLSPSPSPTVASPGRVPASPAARARARELGIDLREAHATGVDRLITRRDVERIAAQGPGPRRAAMAAVTTRSMQTIPHFHVTVDLDVSRLVRWREEWNAKHPDVPASANDVFVRVACAALRESPQLNVRYSEGKIEQRGSTPILLVVATDAGLMLAPIADPTGLPWEEYLRCLRRTLEQARQNRVSEDSASSEPPVLAISNLGMFGVRQFTAIIPPTATAVLAIPAIREQPVVRNHQIVIGQVCAVTLCADHRAVDGIIAAKFLERMQAQVDSL
jgi:pyruvate dehydrogenase E2 component (dihydrolipoyllysine-residue acetyltransferase)